MKTIIFDGKAYRIIKRSFLQILEWIEDGDLELLPEKSAGQELSEEMEKVGFGKEQSIITKLREELERMKSEYRSKKTGKHPGVMTSDDKILEVRANELDIVLLLITSLEEEKETEEAPEFWYVKIDDINGSVYEDIFKQWWEGKTGKGWKYDGGNYGWHYGYDAMLSFGLGRPEIKQITPIEWYSWFYITQSGRQDLPRPQQIREVIVPEFDWDWVMKQLEENQKLNLIPFTALAVMATHIGALDKWQKALQKHPLFNNQK